MTRLLVRMEVPVLQDSVDLSVSVPSVLKVPGVKKCIAPGGSAVMAGHAKSRMEVTNVPAKITIRDHGVRRARADMLHDLKTL